MKNIIAVNQLNKKFMLGDTEVSALNNINIKINPGETLILSGPSGSGKSTLLQLIGCLDRPSSGDIHVLGQNINITNDNRLSLFRAEHLGFVFQTFNLIPVLSVYENIEYPLLLNKMTDRRDRVLDILNKVGLEKHAHQYPSSLSGGQRQRVAIARALVHNPSILIADEPTANLDSQTGDTILDLMFDLAYSKNTTIILSSHDLRIINRNDKRQVKLFDGEIIEDCYAVQHKKALAG